MAESVRRTLISIRYGAVVFAAPWRTAFSRRGWRLSEGMAPWAVGTA
jgi:hypothetical protein